METARGNIGDVRMEYEGRALASGFLVQAKKGVRPNPWRALREATESASFDFRQRGSRSYAPMPVAVIHKDQTHPGQGAEQMVAMPPWVFARLARHWVARAVPDLPNDADLSL